MLAMSERIGSIRERSLCGLMGCALALLILVAMFSFRLGMFRTRWLNPDEFEHLHAAWCTSKGMVLYRDFFEHHTPWLYYLLAPLLRTVNVESNPYAAIRAIAVARGISLFLAAGALGVLVWVGKEWGRGAKPGEDGKSQIPDGRLQNEAGGRCVLVGLVGTVLLAGMPMFLDKTIEIRPDVPAVLLWALCLGWLGRGFGNWRRRGELSTLSGESAITGGPWAGYGSFLAGGLCLGAAIMFTQKMLFTLPGLGMAWLAWVLFGGAKGGLRSRLSSAGMFCAGVVVPCLMTWAFFAAQHAGFAFIENNFLLNARWKAAETPEPFLKYIVQDNWGILLLAGGGCLLVWRNAGGVGAAFGARRVPALWKGSWRRHEEKRGDTAQSKGFASLEARLNGFDWLGLALVTSVVGLLLGLLVIPVAQGQYYLMLLPLVALLAGRFLVFLMDCLPVRGKLAFLWAALLLLEIKPVSHALGRMDWRNDGQLAELDFVMTHSAPNEQVMDGWRGLGVFRPHAWYYYFLHPEVRGMLPPAALAAFQAQLDTGKVRPKIIIMDNNLRALSEHFVVFVRENYQDEGNDIWVRKAAGSGREASGTGAFGDGDNSGVH